MYIYRYMTSSSPHPPLRKVPPRPTVSPTLRFQFPQASPQLLSSVAVTGKITYLNSMPTLTVP